MPDAITYCDLIDADPPPRELGPIARRYVRAMSTYVWLGLFVSFVVLPAVMIAFAMPRVETAAWLAAALGGTVWLATRTARKRARLRRVIVEGRQVPARIVRSRVLVVRRGFAAGRRVTLLLEVEGHPVNLSSWLRDLEGATPGHWIRVLKHPEVRDLVIPVVSVT